MMTFMKGRFTYAVAGAMVVLGLVGYLTNTIEGEFATLLITNGLAAFGIRRAI